MTAQQKQTSIFNKEYDRLTRAADKHFGGFGAFTVLLTLIAWLRGEITYKSALYIGVFSFSNIIYSQLALRAKFKDKTKLEIWRLATNFVICPFVYLRLEGPLFPWWPGYVMFTLAAVVMSSFSLEPRKWSKLLTFGWVANLLLVNFLSPGTFNVYQTGYVAGTMVVVGFVTMEWMSMARFYIDRESERARELQESLQQLQLEKAKILRLHAELEEERAISAQSSKMAALGEMAGGIAHEINTPLAVISLNASLLPEFLDVEDPQHKHAKETIDRISVTVKRIAGIIAGLRTYSRDASNDPEIKASVCNIVDETVELCKQRFRDHEVEIRIGEVANAAIFCRPAQVSQALLNLMNNAFDAVQASKEKWVKLEVRNTADSVQIVLCDSGPGIPNEIAEKIFHPFFTTKSLGKGTGLGLSIAKKLIESQHGHLVLDQYSAHTSFIMEFPKANASTELLKPVSP